MPVVNLDGVDPGDLILDGPTLADIFLGKITKWDDAGDQEAEPEVEAAVGGDRRRASFGRIGHHLQLHQLSVQGVSADWKSKVGENTAVEWPVGIGAKGNEGVANNVANTKGAIGYVEYAYAKQNKLTYTKMVNKDGKTVAPTTRDLPGRRRQRRLGHAPGFYQILTDQPGAQSWPITAATFILLPKEPQDTAAAAEALKFFGWAFANGGKAAEELDYIPLPANVVALIKKSWAANIKDASGKPLASNN